jgi:hypothetical protein
MYHLALGPYIKDVRSVSDALRSAVLKGVIGN